MHTYIIYTYMHTYTTYTYIHYIGTTKTTGALCTYYRMCSLTTYYRMCSLIKVQQGPLERCALGVCQRAAGTHSQKSTPQHIH